MQEFTPIEYIYIDIANNAFESLDKQTYEQRLIWAKNTSVDDLWDIADENEWRERPLYIKALIALDDFKKSVPSGHLVGFDAAASGLQIMSAITGCEKGCKSTGLITQDIRSDAYAIVSKAQSAILNFEVETSRKKIKAAAMTYAYGSTAEPKRIYGAESVELAAFYDAMQEEFPGACEMLQECLSSWIAYADTHQWIMPDNAHVDVSNYLMKERQISLDELGGSGFKYRWYEIGGEKYSKKNCANLVHSCDAYVLRSVYRHCNYDESSVLNAQKTLQFERGQRRRKDRQISYSYRPEKGFETLKDCYERSMVLDICILDHLDSNTVTQLTDTHLDRLLEMTASVLAHKPFPIVTIHDEFRSHPNYMNHLRRHYSEVMSYLVDSRLLPDILYQISGKLLPDATKDWGSPELAKVVKKANYALS